MVKDDPKPPSTLNQPDSDPNLKEPELAKVGFRAPPFWDHDPESWFNQLEGQFHVSGISADMTKYSYVVAALDYKILASVRDILRNPPESDKYTTLKSRLMEVHSQSESEKLKLLVQDLDLGDKKPSQLLREMRNLADNKFDEGTLGTLWRQRLPINIQQILSAAPGDLNTLAKIADKIFEVSAPSRSVASCSELPAPSRNQASGSTVYEIQALRAEISALKDQVGKLFRQRSPKRNLSHSRNRSRRRSHSRDQGNGNLCWYHAKYADKALKCKAPCNFREN